MGVTGGRRFLLRSSVDAVAVGGEIYLTRAGDEDLVIRDPGGDDRALLSRLAGDGVALDDGVRDKLEALDAAGVLVPAASSPALDPEDADRFSRQLPYLAEYGDERDLQRRLGRARVTVLGCGGLGSWALAALAAAGVRRFRLVDDDVVELSNLNRQAIYKAEQVGMPKVQAAAAWLRAFDPRAAVDPVAQRVGGAPEIAGLVADADALVLTADEPAYELGRWANAACVDARVPFITAGQLPPVIRVGPLYVPGRTACFACHETALRRESVAYDAYVEHVRTTPSRAATLGPTSATVGALLAMELIHLLIGAEPATAGAAMTLDIRTLEARHAPVPRDPGCEACARLW